MPGGRRSGEERIPHGRIGVPEESGNAAALLSAVASRSVTFGSSSWPAA